MGLFDRLIEKPHALRTLVVLVVALVFVVDGFLWHRYREEVSLAMSSAARYQPTSELVSAQDDAQRPMAIFLGDSFTEGVGGHAPVSMLARRAGSRVWTLGLPGWAQRG